MAPSSHADYFGGADSIYLLYLLELQRTVMNMTESNRLKVYQSVTASNINENLIKTIP